MARRPRTSPRPHLETKCPKDDSNSVKNQRDLLGDFYRRHMDEFESYTEYVDDGHTGTDTERESFQRLLGDVMNGKINCVVVKDLSRFARNYSDAGKAVKEGMTPVIPPRKNRNICGNTMNISTNSAFSLRPLPSKSVVLLFGSLFIDDTI